MRSVLTAWIQPVVQGTGIRRIPSAPGDDLGYWVIAAASQRLGRWEAGGEIRHARTSTRPRCRRN